MSEEAVLIKSNKSDFKQGRARKVNADNFYLICECLTNYFNKNESIYYDNDLDEKLKTWLLTAPAEKTSKSYITKKINDYKNGITKREQALKTGNLALLGEEARFFIKSEADIEKGIEAAKHSIDKLNKSYIALTDAILYELHLFVCAIQDDNYKKIVSWIKQKRFRNKQKTYQVTLDENGKNALDYLKEILGSSNFNDTLTKAYLTIMKNK